MKFKYKALIYVAILVCVWQMLAGCQAEQKDTSYESYVTSVSNGEAGISTIGTLWPAPDLAYDKSQKGTSNSCEFMGRHYTGEYSSSTPKMFTPEIYNAYMTSDGIVFYLDRETNALRILDLKNDDFYDAERHLEDVDDPEGTAIAVATEIAERYIRPSDYERTVERKIYSEGTEEECDTYSVYFKKYIQGYSTSECFTVRVTSKGTVSVVLWDCLGGFDDISVEIDKQKVNSSVMARIEEEYSKTSYTVLQAEIASQILARTQADDAGIYSEVHLTLQQGNATYSSAVGVFTYLPNA